MLYHSCQRWSKIFLKSLISAWIQYPGKHTAAQKQGWLFLIFLCDCIRLCYQLDWVFQYLHHHRTIHSQIFQHTNHEIICLNGLVATISCTVCKSFLMHTVITDFILCLWRETASSVFNFRVRQPLEKVIFLHGTQKELKITVQLGISRKGDAFSS